MATEKPKLPTPAPAPAPTPTPTPAPAPTPTPAPQGRPGTGIEKFRENANDTPRIEPDTPWPRK